MRVLFAYRYLSVGGVETVLRSRILGLDAYGVEAHALFLQNLGGERVFDDCRDRIRLATLDEARTLLGSYDLFVCIDTPELFPRNGHASPPWVLEVHSSLPPFVDYLRELQAPWPSALLVPSLTQAITCAQRLAQPLPTLVIRNSVHERFLRPLESAAGVPPRPVVAVVGRTDEIKNWQGALDAAAALAKRGCDFELWFIGRGGARPEQVFAGVRDRHLLSRFKWMPSIPVDRMPRLLDVVRESGGALLTTSRRESLGMAVLEAMARACPVVAPSEPPFTEYLSGGENALLYSPACSAEAAGPLLALLSDRDLGLRLGNHARDVVLGTYSPAVVLDGLARVLRGLVAGTVDPETPELLRLGVTSDDPAVSPGDGQKVGPESLSVDLDRARWERQEADLHALAGRLRAELEATTSAASQETARLRAELTLAQDRVASGERQLAEALSALTQEQATARVARAAAEQHRRELVRFQGSRLWKLGAAYWKVRRALGLDSIPASPSEAPLPTPEAIVAPPLPPPLDTLRPAIPGGLPARHDLLCLPIIDWGFRFQRPQQLMARFAEAGHRVFYVCHRFRQEGPPYELREVRPRVFEVCLRAPSLNVYRDAPRDGVEAMWEGIDALRRDAALGATATIVQLPFWGPLAERLRESFAWPVVYDCLDLHRGFSTNEAPMLELETALLGSADLVAASAAVLEQEARRHNPNVVRIPNACEFEHFSAIPQRPPGTTPVVGYYGAISDWFDSALVGELARRHPDWQFLLVGATFGADLGPLEAQPNVELPGEVSYADLPGWLERFDVCLIPFRRTPLTEATDPVKVYEMLAAGKPIVATPLPEVMALGELVRTAAEVGAFEREIAAALAETGSAPAERRRSFAAEQTWEHRYRQLAPAVAATFPRLSIVIVAYNNVDLTLRCLESLHEISEWPNVERIVVDNASADGTAEALAQLQRSDPGLQLVLNSENRGFAAANNQGLAAASGDFVVLLNNDTVVSRGALATLVRHLQARPEIGLLGPCTNAISNVAQIEVGYGDLSEMNDWAADWTWRSDGRVARLGMAAMFCLAMRREVLELLGPLDERFAIGMFEDDDYSLRARRAGLEVCCAYDAFVHHEQMAAFRLVGDDAYQRIFEENRDRFEQKWGPRPAGGHPLSAAVLSRPPREIARRAAAAAGTVILLPSIGWGVHLVQRPHHLARALARRGYFVVFDCSNSQDPVDGFLELEPNLFLFRGKPEVLHGLPAPLLWSFPYNYHLCADFPEGAVALYDWIDDLEVFPHDPRMLEENFRRALAEAPIVASVAHRLHAQALAHRSDALYLPNAVDVAHFTQTQPVPPDDHEFAAIVASGRRIAGYYGALADWFDYELLAEVAARRADWAFVLIGPDYAGSLRRNRGTLRAENIYCLGPRDYARLPAYLAHFDVATIPFRINDITLATSPLKLFEYFAGGKPVVTTPMPECMAFPEVVIAAGSAGSDGPDGPDGSDGPDGLNRAEAFSRGLDEALRRVADPAFRERLHALAHENDWDSRVTAAVALWESKRHVARRSTPWTTRPAAPRRVNPPLPLALETEPVAAPAALVTPPQAELPGSALATRFAHLRPQGDRAFFDALLAHFAGIADHPFLPVYVEYAATTVARGRQAVEAIRPHLELTGTRALDIGCAYGGFLVALSEAGARPVGIDVNPRLLELARTLAADHGAPLELYCHDTTKDREEFRGAFDLIVANDVIEHVAALDGFLANLSGWLSPAGLAYLEIPNGRFPGFVRKDGHHGAFAVSLLEFPVAAEILRSTGLASAYDTFNYLTLDQYRARFAEHGLALEVLDETTAWVTREAVLAEVDALRTEWRARLSAEIPAPWQAVVAKALEGYLEELEASGLDRPGRESELFERYGVSFWKVLTRHLPEG